MTADPAFIDLSVEDLDRELAAGDLSADDHARLREHYERLRTAEPTPPRRVPWLVTSASIAASVLLGLLVARFAGERLPSQTLTGSTNDMASTLAEARGLLATDRKAAAAKFTEVLAARPDNAEALTYSAWIRRLEARESGATAEFAVADAELVRAAAADPQFADPHCFRAVIRFRDLADPVTSFAELRACRSLNPTQQVLGLIAGVSSDVDAALAASADPVVAALAQARAARDTKPTVALDLYAKVLAADRANAEALTWRAYVLARVAVDAGRRSLMSPGQVTGILDGSVATLDTVLGAGLYGDAACAKAIILAEQERVAAAEQALAVCRAGVATPELRDVANAAVKP